MSKSSIIVGYRRSAFCRAFKGALRKMRPEDMLAPVITRLLDDVAVAPSDIEDLIVGCAFPEGEQGYNIARIVTFLSGLPLSVAGVTVNRFCGSSMQSIHMAAGNIALNGGDVFIAAGVESMSRVPMMGYNPMPHPRLIKDNPAVYMSMIETAEIVANDYKIERSRQEEFACASHEKAFSAQSAGHFDEEILPLTLEEQRIDQDSCIRSNTTQVVLSELSPLFNKNGTVTAGTSSPLTDGASAVLICSEDYAMTHGLEILARIKGISVSGCSPSQMGIGPIGAIQKVLSRSSLSLDQIDIIELNEAFASQALACMDELRIPAEKVNCEGGLSP